MKTPRALLLPAGVPSRNIVPTPKDNFDRNIGTNVGGRRILFARKTAISSWEMELVNMEVWEALFMEASVAKSESKDLPPDGLLPDTATPHFASDAIKDPLSMALAAHGKQAHLAVEEAVHEAREALRAASELVASRGLAMNDAYLRHHLLSLARDITALSKSVKAQTCQTELGPPSFARVLDQEIARLAVLFPNRLNQIIRRAVAVDFRSSWTAAYIFGALARTMVTDAIRQTSPETGLSVRLRQDREILRFGIDGAGSCTEAELMNRIAHPRRFRALVSSLSGRIERAPNGITIRMPVMACSQLEPFEIEDV